MRLLLRVIAVVQLFFGVLFTVVPGLAGGVLGLGSDAPGWAHWLFVMMGARFLGYAVGMAAAARNPAEHVSWIDTMIVVQVIDLVGTIVFLAAGEVPLARVASAIVLPVLFVSGLLWWHPRRSRTAGGDSRARVA